MLTQMPELARPWSSEAQEVEPNTKSGLFNGGRLRCSLPKHLSVSPEQYRMAKTMVEEAVRLRKIFSIQGPFPVIRAALRERGWVERHLPETNLLANEESNTDPDIHQLMSIIAKNERPYFFWTARTHLRNGYSLLPKQITNHCSSSRLINTKVGLCERLRNLHWFDEADPTTFFPRCYNVGAVEEMQDFIADFKRTACTSLLQHVVERNDCKQQEQAHLSKEKGYTPKTLPTIKSRAIETALQVCKEYLDRAEHKDVDEPWASSSTLTDQEWTKFLRDYYLAVHDGAEIEQSARYVDRCRAMLGRLGDVCPQLGINGTQNVWIIKPAAQARGRGIVCNKRLNEILSVVRGNPTTARASRWVVQKYIERPFLVHGTKVDLRQWFLVTDWNSLTVWFYNKSYVRFSTQPYSLDELDRSVHLCNNSVQRYLQPSPSRHPEIPEDSMWCCHQFRQFLATQGKSAKWERVVLPQMKKAIICALKSTLDQQESRRGSFELFGADFMLDEDLNPWLIEINSSPSLEPNTALKAKLCAAVQEDTLRVVLDAKMDAGAYTGGFELIYRQAAIEIPECKPANLCVEGVGIKTRRHASQTGPCRSILRPVAPRQCLLSTTEATTMVPKPPPKNSKRMVAQDVHIKPTFQRRVVPAASATDRSQRLTQLLGALRQHQQSIACKPSTYKPVPPPKKPTTGQGRNLGNSKPVSHRKTFPAEPCRPQASASADRRPHQLCQVTPVSQKCSSPGPALRQRLVQGLQAYKGTQDSKNNPSVLRFPKPVREPTLPPLWIHKYPLHQC